MLEKSTPAHLTQKETYLNAIGVAHNTKGKSVTQASNAQKPEWLQDKRRGPINGFVGPPGWC